jgi:hypothetical protein
MRYKILEDYYHLNEGEIIDTHDSNEQIYLDLMVKLYMAEALEDEDNES